MKKLKILTASVLAAAAIVSCPMTSYSDWEKTGDKTVYVGENGKNLTGWQKIDGKKYYFKKDGSLVTKDKIIGGIRYKFSSDGVCGGKYTGFTKKAQGKRYWKNGKPAENQWIKVKGKRYYTADEGYVRTGTHIIDGYEYNFDSNGVWDGKKKKVTYVAPLDEISEKDIISVSSAFYDEREGDVKEVMFKNKTMLSELWKALLGLKFGDKPDDVYFDAMGVSESLPVMFFSLGLSDGRELTVLFALDAQGEKVVCLDLHGEDEAGNVFFMYDYKDKYICDYTSLLDTATELFAAQE